MPKLFSSKHIERVLLRHGFVFVAQKGSHCKYETKERVVIVPANRREIPIGTFKSILRQAGLREEDFR